MSYICGTAISIEKLYRLDDSEDARRLEEQMGDCSNGIGSMQEVSTREFKDIVKNFPGSRAV